MLEDKRADVRDGVSSGSPWGDTGCRTNCSEHGSVIGIGSEQVERKGVQVQR